MTRACLEVEEKPFILICRLSGNFLARRKCVKELKTKLTRFLPFVCFLPLDLHLLPMSPIPPPPPPPPFASPCIRYTLYLASFLLISTFTSSFLHLSSPLPSSQINLPSSSRPFTLQHSYSGPTFFDNFDFEAISDPTHGYVSYKTREEAERRNLTFVSQFGEEEAYLGMDRAEREPGWPGRASVRIRSKRGYESGMVLVVDVKHMPWGCGTWVSSEGRKEGDVELELKPNDSTLADLGSFCWDFWGDSQLFG